MGDRPRALRFGAAVVVTAVGIICWIAIDGLLGEVLAIGLVSLGLGGVLLLVFYEIGLSEERDLAEDERHRRASRR